LTSSRLFFVKLFNGPELGRVCFFPVGFFFPFQICPWQDLTHWEKESTMKRNYSLFKIAVLGVIGTAVAVLAVISCTDRPQKAVQVTAQMIASQQAGRPYVIDLTRRGAIYDVAAGADYGRVEVRTSDGNIALNDFVRRRRFPAGERLLLGSLSDLVNLLPPDGGHVAEFSCEGPDNLIGECTCNGRKDCSDLSKSGKCKSGPENAGCGNGAGGGSGWGCWCDAQH
jgi:hypothetical protein